MGKYSIKEAWHLKCEKHLQQNVLMFKKWKYSGSLSQILHAKYMKGL